MRLVPASLDAPEGLEAFMVEFVEGERGVGGSNDFRPAQDTMTDVLQRMIDRSEGRQLLPGWVPFTTYWLLDEDGAVVAYSRLGHALNDGLLHHGGHIGYYVKRSERRKGYGRLVLALTLAEGRKRGIECFLLTVDSDNAGSIRVIEANGGVPEDERIDPEGRKFRRYWIG
jgi:predicted acetyltransferase